MDTSKRWLHDNEFISNPPLEISEQDTLDNIQACILVKKPLIFKYNADIRNAYSIYSKRPSSQVRNVIGSAISCLKATLKETQPWFELLDAILAKDKALVNSLIALNLKSSTLNDESAIGEFAMFLKTLKDVLQRITTPDNTVNNCALQTEVILWWKYVGNTHVTPTALITAIESAYLLIQAVRLDSLGGKK
jgi:hypothetical protein